MLHLLVCGSKHSMERRQELPSRPPTANSLETPPPPGYSLNTDGLVFILYVHKVYEAHGFIMEF